MYKGKYVSELSMNELKEYYDELRENYPRTEEQWADFNILKERLIVFAYKILDCKTNGEVLKEMFPDMVCYIGEGEEEHMCFGFEMLSDEWVKAPYEIDREVKT